MESVLTVKQRFGIIGDNPKLSRSFNFIGDGSIPKSPIYARNSEISIFNKLFMPKQDVDASIANRFTLRCTPL